MFPPPYRRPITSVSVRPADPDHTASRDQTAALLGRAYMDTPEGRWLVEDTVQRALVFRGLWPCLVGYALRHGTVDVAHDHAGTVIGAAVWFEARPPRDPVTLLRCVADCCAGYRSRVLRYGRLLARHQPQLDGASGLRLAWLAVDGRHSSLGLGGLLLDFRHARLHGATRPAALVANSPRARGLFTRHGYAQQEPPFRLPDDGPPMWPMIRQPDAGG